MGIKQKLAIAGKELMKANFGNVVKALSNDIIPSTYNSNSRNWLFNAVDGGDLYFDFNGVNSCVKAYEECPPIAAIINKKAQTLINGKIWVMNRKGKEATSDTANKIRKLLSKPNPIQNTKQFISQGYIYKQLFGFNVILIMKPVGFSNIDAYQLWNIPPTLLSIEETDSLFFNEQDNNYLSKVILSYKSKNILLNNNNLFIQKDSTSSFSSIYFPSSRIKSISMPINNIIGAYQSRNTLIKRRGALGIISSDTKDESGTVSLTSNEKDDLQKEFLKYGLMKDQYQVIISNAAIKWQQMGYPTRDLMLFEEIEDSTMRICDAYGYPYRLLSSDKNNSLGGSDLKEYKKLLYQDMIIPDAEIIADDFNLLFGLNDLPERIEIDYAHIAIMQEDKQKEAQARKTRNEALQIEFYNNLITLNRWLELNDEDTIGEEGNKYYYQLTALGMSFGKENNTVIKEAINNENNSNQIE